MTISGRAVDDSQDAVLPMVDVWLRICRLKKEGPLRDLAQHGMVGVLSRPRSLSVSNDFLGF